MNTQNPNVQTARTHFAEKNYDLAWSTITDALAQNPADATLQLEYARQLCYRQKEDEAQAIWLQIRDTVDASELEQLLGDYWSCRRAIADKLGVADEPGQQHLNTFVAAAGWQNVNPATKLSAVLITKNEEAHLRKALASIVSKVDEIVVVDTGSTDATVAIAQEYGAKVGSFEWCQDFAKARNASLDLATGDWALWLDADEAVDDESWNGIFEALTRRQFGGYFIRIVNFTDEDENTTYTHAPIRLFQLRNEIWFAGKIHEQISHGIDALGLPIARVSGATIWHYGYKPSELEAKQKVQRTIDLLNQEIAENPNDAFHWFNLANTYAVVSDHENTIEAARKCIGLMAPGNSFGSVAFHTLASALTATNRPDEALAACYEAKAKGYYSILTQFGLAHALYIAQKHSDALEAIDTCMAMEWPEDMTGDRGIVTHKSHVLKAQILTALNRAPKAIELLEYALQVDPNFGLAHFAMGTALEKVNKFDEAISYLARGFNQPGYRGVCLAAAARIEANRGSVETALTYCREAWTQLPGNEELWKLWATTAESTSDTQAKLDCYTAFSAAFQPDPSVWTNWARALAEIGETQGSIQKLEEAQRMPGASANVWLNMADVYYGQGNYLRAAELLQEGLQLDSQNPEAWFVLGNCFAQLGIWSGAKTAYEQTLKMNPQHSRANHNLSMVESQVA